MVDLQKERMSKGLTQEQLASEVGVVRQTICEIERGKNKPSVKVAKKIAEVLDLDWTNFFD